MKIGSWWITPQPGFWLSLIMVAFWFAIFFLPIIRIIQRTGHSGWWSLLVFVPFANVVGLWLLAYGRWPSLER